MCRTQCVLTLAALYVGFAHSWDIAVSEGHQLNFFTDGRKTNTVNFISRNLTALAYDKVLNTILYVDKQSDYDAICGYNLNSMENECFIKRVGSNIHSIAFDPATDTLFFTDINEKSINWVSLKPGSNNNVYGNLLIKIDDLTVGYIAVDSCRGYIYWTSTNNEVCVERARFDSSERETIITLLPTFSFAMDPVTREMYYFDCSESCSDEFLNIADLNGYNERILLQHVHLSAPKELTISKDYLYWFNSSESYKTVWHLPRNAMRDVEPKEISKFYIETPLAIVTNYNIKLQDCEVLSSPIPKIPVTNDLSLEQTTETEQTTDAAVAELFCVHGMKVSETSICKCTPGYIGERCDVSVCELYCLQGDCSFNEEGLPKCRCNAGYSGDRCEVYACHGYCLNDGDCSLNEKSEPVCQCKRDYIGDRCEISGCLNYCIQGNCSFNDDGVPKCSCDAGFSGERCSEVVACHGYCLNNGTCFLNEEDEPFCECVGNYEGTRCEATINDTFTISPKFESVKRNLKLIYC